MKIEIPVIIDSKIKTYTVYKEELEQIACNKAREDNPKAENIFYNGMSINIII